MPNCDGCTACCTLLPVTEINKPRNVTCEHCAVGCSIYKDRPQSCRDFECAYLQGNNIPESLRPDKCGIMFIKKTDRIFVGFLVPGVKITEEAKGQIDSFQKQGFSVILFSTKEEKPLLKLSKKHRTSEIIAEYNETLNGNI
jgi:hypothetical protein